LSTPDEHTLGQSFNRSICLGPVLCELQTANINHFPARDLSLSPSFFRCRPIKRTVDLLIVAEITHNSDPPAVPSTDRHPPSHFLERPPINFKQTN
jgi:hypothetical protein